MTLNCLAFRLGRKFTGVQVLTHKVHCDPLDGFDFRGERRIKKKPCIPMEAWLSAFIRMLIGPHGSELSFCAGNVNLGAVG